MSYSDGRHVFGLRALVLGLILVSNVGSALAAANATVRSEVRVRRLIKVQDARPISVGETLRRELKGGHSHSYVIKLSDGDYLGAVVEQDGIDVIVSVTGPDGTKLVEVDSPYGSRGPEHLRVIAKTSGDYQLHIGSQGEEVLTGSYELKISEVRRSTAQDNRKVITQEVYAGAKELAKQGDELSLKKAATKFEEAASHWRATNDRTMEVSSLLNVGLIHVGLNDRKTARQYLDQALTATRAANDQLGEAHVLYNLGDTFTNEGNFPKAIEHYSQSARISQARGYQELEAIALASIGEAWLASGHQDKALEIFDKVLPAFRRFGDRKHESAVLNALGALYADRGENKKALDFYNQALEVSRSIKDRPGEAVALNNMAMLYDFQGNKQKALELYNQSLEIARADNNHRGQAYTLASIGLLYESVGQKQKALKYYDEALPLVKMIGDRTLLATITINLGGIYDFLGDKQKAYRLFSDGLLITRDTGDRYNEARALNALGVFHSSLRESDKAAEYYEKAVTLFGKLGNKLLEVMALHNLGRAYDELGQHQRAIDVFNRVLPLTQQIGNPQGEATTLSNIGRAYNALGDNQKAIEFYTKALDMSRSIGDRELEGYTLSNLGSIYQLQGQKERAREFYDKALPIIRDVGDPLAEANTLSNIGHLYEVQRDFTKALDFYQRSIDVRERVRAEARVEEFKIRLSEQSDKEYQRAILLRTSLDQPIEAFNLTERARARTFLDQLGNTNLNPGTGAGLQLIQEEQSLRQQVSALEQGLRAAKAMPQSKNEVEAVRDLSLRLQAKQKEYGALVARLKAANPEYLSMRVVNSLTLPEVQKSLNEDTTLLSFFVTPDKTLAFIITRDLFSFVELRVSERDIEAAVRMFRGFATLREPFPPSLNQLYRWLVVPVQPYLKTRKVGIIPHSVLHYLPFAALSDGRRYLDDKHTIFYLPSASVLPLIRQKVKKGDGNLLALARDNTVGLPALRYAEAATKRIAAGYHVTPLLGREATESAFRSRAVNSGLLLLATHGTLNPSNPLFSRIFLAPDKENDGLVELHEVYGMRLERTNLVVLSACRTQLGEHSRGDDIVGLNRAFLYAGAPTVVASLWSVQDEATGQLMEIFFKYLKEGKVKAEALRMAQREMRGQYPNPYYWAAFVLTGAP